MARKKPQASHCECNVSLEQYCTYDSSCRTVLIWNIECSILLLWFNIVMPAGADPGFSEGGSESGAYIEGRANPSIVSLKQGVRGAQPPITY